MRFSRRCEGAKCRFFRYENAVVSGDATVAVVLTSSEATVNAGVANEGNGNVRNDAMQLQMSLAHSMAQYTVSFTCTKAGVYATTVTVNTVDMGPAFDISIYTNSVSPLECAVLVSDRLRCVQTSPMWQTRS